MNRIFSGTMAGLTAIACVLSATPAMAQRYDSNDHRYDRNDHRHDRDDHHRDHRGGHHWRNYGGSYGYNGYHGRWRTGQRFTHWNNSRYYVNDWRAYDLPPPRRGYRYYRDDNGDIVMAAIGSGIIGLILGSQLGR